MVVSPVLVHRLILKPESRLRKISTSQIVGEIVSEIAVPVIGNTSKA
jgi:MoxR-like ATPase